MTSTASALADYQENPMTAEYEALDTEFNQDLPEAPPANVAELRLNQKVIQVADVHDFLKDEEEREQHRKQHIQTILQDSVDREARHQASIKELTELHQHALASNADLLKKLGHVEPPTWVSGKIGSTATFPTAPEAIPAVPLAPIKRRGRTAGSKNAPKAAVPIETAKPKRTYTRKAVSAGAVPNVQPPTDKPKRIVSEATKAKMKKAQKARWKALKAAEGK